MDKEALIQKYFEHTLSKDEMTSFHALLVSDTEFANEVAFQKQLKNAITIEERHKLKETLRGYEAQKNDRIKWWYAAASILVLITVSFWLYNQNPSTEKLYATYFESYPNVIEPIVRNGNNQLMNTKTKAFIAYESKDYSNAAKFFDVVIDETNAEYAQFYKAISLMNIDQYHDAADILKTSDWSETYKSKALWYLALSELKLNHMDQCKASLKQLIMAGNFNLNEAKELLEKLD